MALKTSNKNRIKNPAVALVEEIVTDTQETTIAAITELTELNKDITKANVLWTIVGVTVGVVLLLVII